MQTIAVTLLTMILVLLSVAGGGIFPWTLRAAAIVLPATAIALLLQRDHACKAKNWRSPVWLLFLYLLLMLIPLPSLFHSLSPIRRQANTIATNAIQNFTDSSLLYALTRNQSGTLRFLLLYTAAFAAWNILRPASSQLRLRYLAVLLLLGSLTAVAGILGTGRLSAWIPPQGDTLYWYLPVPHGRPGPMAGFINRNHYAGFLAILAPAALCIAACAMEKRQHLRAAAGLLMMLILSGGVLFSLSRGGTLALIAGLLTTTIFLFFQCTGKTKYTMVALILLLALTAALITHRTPALRERMTQWRSPATAEAVQVRTQAWRDALEVARAYPILGAGPNAFRTVFPQHRLSSERAARDFAENEYVQWFAETGIVGMLLALAIAWIILRTICQQVKQAQPNQLAPVAIGALAAAATHATVDFPIRLPLYAITLASFVAFLWNPIDKNRTSPAPITGTIALSLGLFVTILTLPANLRLDAPREITGASLEKSQRALQAAPTYPIVWRRLAAIHWQNAEQQQIAVDLLTQAAHYDPNNYMLWRTLGERRQALGDNAGANEAYRRVHELRDWVRIPELPESP